MQRVAIFLCDGRTQDDCFKYNLFGTNESYGLQVQKGDFCLLYNYEQNQIFGVWKATTDGGNYEPTAWHGQFPNQVRIVENGEIAQVARNEIQALAGIQNIGRIFEGDLARNLLRHFHMTTGLQETQQQQPTENVFKSPHLTESRASQRSKEDHFLLPGEFICADGDRVSSKDERIIDDWFSRHDVKHQYEPKIQIAGQNLVPDFVVYSRSGAPVLVENWGMTNNEKYDEKRREKTRLYLQNGIKLIQIVPENIKVIDYVLGKELERWDVPYTKRKLGFFSLLLQFLRQIFTTSRRPH